MIFSQPILLLYNPGTMPAITRSQAQKLKTTQNNHTTTTQQSQQSKVKLTWKHLSNKCEPTKNTVSSSNTKPPKQHLQGWSQKNHYMCMGGQCGQSCPCCRAEVYNSGVDPDAKWGACEICLN